LPTTPHLSLRIAMMYKLLPLLSCLIGTSFFVHASQVSLQLFRAPKLGVREDLTEPQLVDMDNLLTSNTAKFINVCFAFPFRIKLKSCRPINPRSPSIILPTKRRIPFKTDTGSTRHIGNLEDLYSVSIAVPHPYVQLLNTESSSV
jgi:hypothetical protein